jgi:hypothetical protein
LLLLGRRFCLVLRLDSLVENEVRIAAALKEANLIGSTCFVIEFTVVVPSLLAAEALLLEVLNGELLDGRVVELEPLSIVLRAPVSLLDEAVVVASVGRAGVDEHAHELVLVLVLALPGGAVLLGGGWVDAFSADLRTASPVLPLLSSFLLAIGSGLVALAATIWTSLLGGGVLAVDALGILRVGVFIDDRLLLLCLEFTGIHSAALL